MLEGTVRFDAGDESFVLTAGQSTTIPLGTPHTFANASADERARLLGTVSRLATSSTSASCRRFR